MSDDQKLCVVCQEHEAAESAPTRFCHACVSAWYASDVGCRGFEWIANHAREFERKRRAKPYEKDKRDASAIATARIAELEAEVKQWRQAYEVAAEEIERMRKDTLRYSIDGNAFSTGEHSAYSIALRILRDAMPKAEPVGIWKLAQDAADEVATWPESKRRAADQALVTEPSKPTTSAFGPSEERLAKAVLDLRVHDLKTWPEYYAAILDGCKKFELRVNDRDFRVGDRLVLREYDPDRERYTGRSLPRDVTYILHTVIGGKACVVMSIEPPADRGKNVSRLAPIERVWIDPVPRGSEQSEFFVMCMREGSNAQIEVGRFGSFHDAKEFAEGLRKGDAVTREQVEQAMRAHIDMDAEYMVTDDDVLVGALDRATEVARHYIAIRDAYRKQGGQWP